MFVPGFARSSPPHRARRRRACARSFCSETASAGDDAGAGVVVGFLSCWRSSAATFTSASPTSCLVVSGKTRQPSGEVAKLHRGPSAAPTSAPVPPDQRPHGPNVGNPHRAAPGQGPVKRRHSARRARDRQRQDLQRSRATSITPSSASSTCRARTSGRPPADAGGLLRDVISQLTPEQVNQDRIEFANQLVQVSNQIFCKLGLCLIP